MSCGREKHRSDTFRHFGEHGAVVPRLFGHLARVHLVPRGPVPPVESEMSHGRSPQQPRHKLRQKEQKMNKPLGKKTVTKRKKHIEAEGSAGKLAINTSVIE